jgi:hypothetical protein
MNKREHNPFYTYFSQEALNKVNLILKEDFKYLNFKMFDNITHFFDEYVKKDLLLQNNNNNLEENTDKINENYDNQNQETNIIENNITQIYDIINTNMEENYSNHDDILHDDILHDDILHDDTQIDNNINSKENIDFISELLIMNNKI